MSKISKGEAEVLLLLVEGLSNQAIADKICRSEKAVKGRLTGLYKKLEVKGRLEAVAKYHNYEISLPKKKEVEIENKRSKAQSKESAQNLPTGEKQFKKIPG